MVEHVEHIPWKGQNYDKGGINGQRIAIVGHSHHSEEEDTDNLTLDVMREVTTGRSYKFFDQIQDYFGFLDGADFWNRVVFFNFLPDSVGSDEERYKHGTPEQIARGKERFRRLLSEYHPQKVLVFSKTIWSEMEPLREEEASDSSGEKRGDGFSWGTYELDGQIVMVFNLHHPERAPKDRQTRAVQQILAMPLQK
jgi:hypothetical protein